MKKIRAVARWKKLMTKDDIERHLSMHALTPRQQQLEALKERYENAGQLDGLDSATQAQMAIDCHKVLASIYVCKKTVLS